MTARNKASFRCTPSASVVLAAECWTEHSRQRPAAVRLRYSPDSVAPSPTRRPVAAGRLAGMLAVVCLLRPHPVPAQSSHALDLTMEPGERWWAGITSESHRMPLGRVITPLEIEL